MSGKRERKNERKGVDGVLSIGVEKKLTRHRQFSYFFASLHLCCIFALVFWRWSNDYDTRPI